VDRSSDGPHLLSVDVHIEQRHVERRIRCRLHCIRETSIRPYDLSATATDYLHNVERDQWIVFGVLLVGYWLAFALYPLPGPNYKGAVDNASAESAYYDFVDRFDMLGVGKDIPIATGNLSESLLALVDGRFLTLRVPYPLGFFAKGMDGRIDDPNGGWKGKGIFTTWATRAPFHAEGGKVTTSKLVKFQMRPDPLSK